MLEMDHESVSQSVETLKNRIPVIFFVSLLLAERWNCRFEVRGFGQQLLHGSVIAPGRTLGGAVGKGLAEILGELVGRPTDHMGDRMTMVANIRVLCCGDVESP